MTYDVAIVGSGPAAISAALTLKLHDKSIIWFGSKALSPKVEKSELIANYPGVAKVAGSELNRLLLEQIDEAGLEITERQVTSILPFGESFMLTIGSEVADAKTVLLAIGATNPKGFPGEEEFLGRGVSYCATCDGFLYRGKTIAVFCGAKEFEHEVTYLAELAEKVYLFAPYAGCDVTAENVVVNPGKLRAIQGEMRVTGIELTDGTRLGVDGVFVIRPAVAPGRLLPGLGIDGADIVVNRKMETNVAGCYAAGDCTGRPYQLTKATGEGNIAAHSIVEYLAQPS